MNTLFYHSSLLSLVARIFLWVVVALLSTPVIGRAGVYLNSYNFSINNLPSIYTDEPMPESYRLRAKFSGDFHATQLWNNDWTQLQSVPGPGTHTVELYWVKYQNGETIVGPVVPQTVVIDGSNTPPQTQWVSATNGVPGQAITLSANATDPDGNLYWFSFYVTGPSMPGWNYVGGAEVGNSGNATATIAWTIPGDAAVGTYTAHIRVLDRADQWDWNGNVTSTFSILRATQPSASSQNRTTAVGGSFIPDYFGGAGNGAWQFVVGNQTNWGGSAPGTLLPPNNTASSTWTPPSVGIYQFWVRKTEDNTYAESNSAGPYTLTVNGGSSTAPAISNQPQSQILSPGQTATFWVAASGTPPFTYQWRKNGADLAGGGNVSGASGTTLTVSNVQASDVASYDVIVRNGINPDAVSNVATLSVSSGNSSRSVTISPNGTITVPVNSPVTFASTATSPNAQMEAHMLFWKDPAGRWNWEGGAVGMTFNQNTDLWFGRQSSSTRQIVATPTQVGTFYIEFEGLDEAGWFESSLVTVIVTEAGTSGTPPSIVNQPQTQVVTAGTNVQFQVSATGSPTPTYQWRKNGANLVNGGTASGATTSNLTLSGVQASDAGNYDVVASNGISPDATSSVAGLTVNNGGGGTRSVTISPNGTVTVAVNTPVTFASTATSPNAQMEAHMLFWKDPTGRWNWEGGATGMTFNQSTDLWFGRQSSSTRQIVATPTQVGTFYVEFEGLDEAGWFQSSMATVVVTGGGIGSPSITSASTSSGTYGTGFSFQIGATNSPASYGATGLPAGLSIGAATGAITGAPTTVGQFNVTVSASNSSGTGTATLVLTIAKAIPRGTFSNVTVYNQNLLTVTSAMLNATFAHPTNSGVPAPSGTATYTAVRTNNPSQSYNPFTAQSVSSGLSVYYGPLQVTAAYPGDSFYQPATVSATFVNLDTIRPDPPTNLRVAVVGPTSFSVNWDATTDIPSNQVATMPPYEVTLQGAGMTLQSYTTHKFNGLQPGASYNVSVRVRDWSDNWSNPATLAAPVTLPLAPTQSSQTPRWADVNGDGIRDEVIGGDTTAFNYIIAETAFETVTYESWTSTFVPILGFNYNDGYSFFVSGWWIPDVETETVTINTVRPLFQLLTEPGYDYAICRAVTNPQGVTSYVRLKTFLNLGGAGGIEEWMPAGFWPEDVLYAFPTVLARLGKPIGGVSIAGIGTTLGGSRGLGGVLNAVLPSSGGVVISIKDTVDKILKAGPTIIYEVWDGINQIRIGTHTLGNLLDVGITTSGQFQVGLKLDDSTKVWFNVNVPPPPVFITPAGDPVNAPVDAGTNPANIPDGANEFVFSSAAPGVLTISLKVKINGIGNAPASEQAKYRFDVDAVGNSTKAWTSSHTDGKPTFAGDFMEAKVTFIGLPQSNTAFGRKKARLYSNTSVILEADYEVFYLATVSNHPGGTSDPNWFYYYKDADGGTDYSYGGPSLLQSVSTLGVPGSTKIANNAYTGNFYIETYVDATGMRKTTGNTPEVKFFRCFSGVVAHERFHMSNGGPHGSALDPDADLLKTAFETSTSFSDPNDKFSMARAHFQEQLSDDEVWAGGVVEKAGIDGADIGKDWAKPGSNSP